MFPEDNNDNNQEMVPEQLNDEYEQEPQENEIVGGALEPEKIDTDKEDNQDEKLIQDDQPEAQLEENVNMEEDVDQENPEATGHHVHFDEPNQRLLDIGQSPQPVIQPRVHQEVPVVKQIEPKMSSQPFKGYHYRNGIRVEGLLPELDGGVVRRENM